MPPSLALFLCLSFILFAFWVDARRKPNVSGGLWIPLIWLLIIGSKPLSLWLGLSPGGFSPDGTMDGSPLDRNVYSILILMGCFTLARRRIAWSAMFSANHVVLLLFVYIALSILWTPDPYVSFKRYVKLLGMLVMVLVVLTERDPLEAVRTIARRWSYVLIPVSILLIKYYPHLGVVYWPWGGERMLVGVCETKNMFGQLLLITGLSLVWTITARLRDGEIASSKMQLTIDGFVLLLTMHLLQQVDSATSLVCFVLGIVVLHSVRWPFVRRRIGTWILVAVVAVGGLHLSADLFQSLTEALGRDPTLTNRTEIWQDLLAMRTNALVGTGFEGFWTPQRWATIAVTYRINSAHNGYLEVFLSLGLIGLSLWMLAMIAAYKNCRNLLEYNYPFGRLALSLLFVVLVYNITESGFRGLGLIPFSFLLVVVDARRSREMYAAESTEFMHERKDLGHSENAVARPSAIHS